MLTDSAIKNLKEYFLSLFRLTRHITFLEDELKDHEKFKLLTWEDIITTEVREGC